MTNLSQLNHTDCDLFIYIN